MMLVDFSMVETNSIAYVASEMPYTASGMPYSLERLLDENYRMLAVDVGFRNLVARGRQVDEEVSKAHRRRCYDRHQGRLSVARHAKHSPRNAVDRQEGLLEGDHGFTCLPQGPDGRSLPRSPGSCQHLRSSHQC